MTDFFVKYQKARKEKNSILCIGLDPSPEEKDVLGFCKKIIEETSDYACAYKPNSQYILFSLCFDELKQLSKVIKDAGCVSILDHKLSDIGSSNDSALQWTTKAGFDSITVSPFPGNIKETTESAHRNGLGVFILTLMSNPEAKWIQKETKFLEKPLYQKIASEVKKYNSDGVVVGTTGHVTSKDIKLIRKTAGKDAVFLCPGIGAQGGDLGKILDNAGENVLINVGRDIFKDKNPGKKASEYNYLINKNR